MTVAMMASVDELLPRQGALWLRLLAEPVWRPIDRELSHFLLHLHGQLLGEDDPAVVVSLALLSHELGDGHVCLTLDAIPERMEALGLSLWLGELGDLNSLASRLRSSPLVAQPERNSTPSCPLVLDQGRLYLARYHDFEFRVATWLTQSSGDSGWDMLPVESLRFWLDELFRPDAHRLLDAWQLVQSEGQACADFARRWLDVREDVSLDWTALAQTLCRSTPEDLASNLAAVLPAAACFNGQKLAVATASAGRFTLISGGPGTGKTTTVARLLVLLQQLAMSRPDAAPLLIRLAAPTGKAAARLTESLGRALDELSPRLDATLLASLPRQASTLHRLLGVIPGSHEFRHHAENPLPLDVLVVDEASMVDLPMMARLLAALPASARLILLGDKDQLASVEAGAVLGDICQLLQQEPSAAHTEWLRVVTGYPLAEPGVPNALPLRDRLCWLRKSWRFHAGSGIGRLADAVNQGDRHTLERLLSSNFADIRIHVDAERRATLLQLAVAGYAGYLALARDPVNGESARRMLQAFQQTRVLCALREGEWGVTGLNSSILQSLSRQGWLQPEADWYVGRPVMIVRNDHALGLYNGDIGITAHDGERLRVWFEMPDGRVHGFLPSRLPEHETALAMTVHKSQGSEFAHTILVLPDLDNPVLTRELLYTGITRAKQRLDLFGAHELLTRIATRPTQRNSGLTAMLLRYGSAD
jgi:exodeoxyribonuclease V alpha subunit